MSLATTVREILARCEELAEDATEAEVLEVLTSAEAAIDELEDAAKLLARFREHAAKRWLWAQNRTAVWLVDREAPERSVRWRLKPKTRVRHRRGVATILGDIVATYPEPIEVLERVLSESVSAWKRRELREVMGDEWVEQMFREERVEELAADSPTKKQVSETLAREEILFFPRQARERIVKKLREEYGIPEPESEVAA